MAVRDVSAGDGPADRGVSGGLRRQSVRGHSRPHRRIYIGKAASLGIDCRVQVEVRTEDGLPLPYGASLDVERDQVLSDYMAQELGIPASRQSWQPEE